LGALGPLDRVAELARRWFVEQLIEKEEL